ncbi:hypothetical protein O181_010301 [Austropuccinia psidii MF-1]|uniref:Reverse transcriptase domain-containing protein n=1 Tax=Austropuccinia psidii MF-1 TaxID=1389203 RepID=A0A9Q3BTH8_9BASI|nr:hypothetical protein [Austropuccinia psidii MF-1]
MLRKDSTTFSIGEEPLGKVRGHDLELYLDVERPYPPMLRRPPYPESLETRREIEKHINELLDMDVIRKIGHNEIVGITTPVLITWQDSKSRLCEDSRALNNYTKADRYPIPKISHALYKLGKAKYMTKMDCMKGFQQNGIKPNSLKLLRIICHIGIYEYTRMQFGIKNAPAHFQRMMDKIFQEEIFEGWMVVYIYDIITYSEEWEDHVKYIDRVLNKSTPINLKISLKKCNFGQKELLSLGHKVPGLILAIDQNKVAAVPQKPVPNNIKEIQSFLVKLKDSESRYGATQTECLCLVWALGKPHYYLEGTVFEVYTDCTALRYLLNMKNNNRHMLRCQIAIQEYRGDITIIYKESKSHTNANDLRKWPLDNVKSNPAYDPELAAKIPIHFMEIDRRKNFRFSEWAPGSSTPESGDTGSEGK